MKFKKGDKVSFLNDIGGGKVNRIDERGYVYVLTEDGFEIPVAEKELVHSGGFSFKENHDEPQYQAAVVSHEEPPKKKKEKVYEAPHLPENIVSDAKANILLGFVPEDSGPVFNSQISLYLINDSPFFLYYVVGSKEGGLLYHLSSGLIESDTKNLIKSFDHTALSKISDLHVQLLFLSKGKYSRKEPVDQMIHLYQVNFNKESYYRENEYFDNKAVIFTIQGKHDEGMHHILTIPEEIKEQKIRADNPAVKPAKKEPVTDTLEVDLHFDQDNSQLSPGAILALQMSRFHSAIEEAISKNLRRVVVIHGLGQGTLKMQIRKELQEKYPGFIYQDASFKEYGFGATMVHLNFDK